MPKHNLSKIEICEIEMGVESELEKYMYPMSALLISQKIKSMHYFTIEWKIKILSNY